jgi:alpha-ketoglutarate-dependent taurine dioxygenase
MNDDGVLAGVTVTPLKAGAMIDAPGQSGSDGIDIGLVRDTLERYGAVLIRGGARDRQAFVDLTERFGIGFMEYVGGANNDRASAFGQSATVLTVTGGNVDKQAIPLHGEMFYTKPRPATLFFGCIRPADANGQTTICDGVAFWNALPPEIQAIFAEKKLSYRRIYTDDTWKKTYKTDDIDHVRALCAQNGVEFIDRGQGHFETLHVSYAWSDHKAGRAFINSLLVWAAREHLAKIGDSQVRFADGTPMTPELLYKVHAIGESQTLNIPWEPGMVAIVDNTRVMHGRRAYEDSGRDIIMRLSLEPLVAPAPMAAE